MLSPMPKPITANPARRYLAWFFATLALLVLLVGSFNLLADPLGLFGSPRIAGFNRTKPHLDHHQELTRWRLGQAHCASAVVLGNSRAEIGLDPAHPSFAKQGLSAVNLAVPGSDAVAAYRQLLWLQSVGCMPKLVILGVEFFDFLGAVPARELPTLQNSPAPARDARVLAETVFSLTALGDALGTVAAQHARYPATLTDRGFNPLLNYVAEVSRSGHHALFRQRAVENAKAWARKPPQIQPPGGGQSDDAQAVRAILDLCAAAGSKVHLVIYPYHAQIRLMLEQMGLGELFSAWKHSVVSSVGGPPSRPVRAAGGVTVWDFSGLSSQTQEPIPPAGDRQTQLGLYWEAGHFKQALGDQMLDRMLGGPGDFGQSIDPQGLSAWLAQDRLAVQNLLALPSPLRDASTDALRQAGVTLAGR